MVKSARIDDKNYSKSLHYLDPIKKFIQKPEIFPWTCEFLPRYLFEGPVLLSSTILFFMLCCFAEVLLFSIYWVLSRHTVDFFFWSLGFFWNNGDSSVFPSLPFLHSSPLHEFSWSLHIMHTSATPFCNIFDEGI